MIVRGGGGATSYQPYDNPRLAAVGNVFRLSVPDIYTSTTTDIYEYIWAYGIYSLTDRTYTYLMAPK